MGTDIAKFDGYAENTTQDIRYICGREDDHITTTFQEGVNITTGDWWPVQR